MCYGFSLCLQLGRAGWGPFPAEELEGSGEFTPSLIEEGAAVEKLSQTAVVRAAVEKLSQ